MQFCSEIMNNAFTLYRVQQIIENKIELKIEKDIHCVKKLLKKKNVNMFNLGKRLLNKTRLWDKPQCNLGSAYLFRTGGFHSCQAIKCLMVTFSDSLVLWELLVGLHGDNSITLYENFALLVIEQLLMTLIKDIKFINLFMSIVSKIRWTIIGYS